MTPEIKKSMISVSQPLLVHSAAARNPEAAAWSAFARLTTVRASNPSPEIQAGIDCGHDQIMWNLNQSDLYATW